MSRKRERSTTDDDCDGTAIEEPQFKKQRTADMRVLPILNRMQSIITKWQAKHGQTRQMAVNLILTVDCGLPQSSIWAMVHGYVGGDSHGTSDAEELQRLTDKLQIFALSMHCGVCRASLGALSTNLACSDDDDSDDQETEKQKLPVFTCCFPCPPEPSSPEPSDDEE